jgi:hypothetical protein
MSRDRVLRTADLARLLGCGPRHVHRLEAERKIPTAERINNQRRWRLADVQPYVEALRRAKPRGQSTFRHHQLAVRARTGRRDLARAMLLALEVAGPAVVLETFRQHGALQGVKGWPAQRIHQLADQLYRSVELIRFR